MEKFEQIFNYVNNRASEIEVKEQITYLDALIETLEQTLDGEYDWKVEGATQEDMRKAIQIAILKGMRQSSQPNHQMTPDSLGLIMGYFVEQFFEKELSQGTINVLDPAVGTGNLLLTVMNLLSGKINATGVEVDETLIRFAGATADLVNQPLTLYRQDALNKLLVDPVDAVVCDLPVGYYPNEEVAVEYELCATEEMSYAHHLFIEQSINHLKEGGYGIFLAPANLFESEQAKQLHKYLKAHAWIQAIIQLPDGMFKNRLHEKCIVILQKKSEQLIAPKEVLLAKLPNVSNKQALALFFEKVQLWKSNK